MFKLLFYSNTLSTRCSSITRLKLLLMIIVQYLVCSQALIVVCRESQSSPFLKKLQIVSDLIHNVVATPRDRHRRQPAEETADNLQLPPERLHTCTPTPNGIREALIL